MEIKEFNGSLFDSKANILIHQTNTSGIMGGGIAYTVRKLYPNVFNEYKKLCDEQNGHSEKNLLGTVQFVGINGTQMIANMFGQGNLGNGLLRPTRYDAVYDGLVLIKNHVLSLGLKSVALPHGMSSCLGGADWEIIRKMVERVFTDTDITVEIWKFK